MRETLLEGNVLRSNKKTGCRNPGESCRQPFMIPFAGYARLTVSLDNVSLRLGYPLMLYLLLKRSTRPAVSTRCCFPV